MRIAAFDFGSNSIKCLIAQSTSKDLKFLRDIRVTNRLAASLDVNANISEEAFRNSTIAVSCIILQTCSSLRVTELLAVGTEALRQAANAAAFVEAMYNATGLRIQIISAEAEAALAWEGVFSAANDRVGHMTLFDSGGASTEIVSGLDGKISQSISLPLGAVSLAKYFLHSDPINAADFQSLSAAINAGVQLPFAQSGQLFGTGGGILACAKVATKRKTTKPAELEGYKLSRAQLEEQINLYKTTNLAERRKIPGMEAERADIILPAAMLYHAILLVCKAEYINVSTYGIRHGLIHRFLSVGK
ncbi:MAG: exopolyphosphatase [Candidatus Cloacimonas sp.]|jgi:exopolyphosphatase/guanosine-5'-triphosphate,3'-diphosphate pyrophosphatase|nr:exopolyphosphatase [Candidatus Cloacimonas sp.]